MRSKILITGGHMTPALAVINELRSQGFQNLVWVGQKYNQAGARETSPEYKTVTKLGIKFIDLRSGKLVRSWHRSVADFWLAVVNLIKLPWGFLKALWIIYREQPKIVVAFGGYIAVPIAFWARVFGKKVLLHEQTVITGVSNKHLANLAHTICISWESSRQYYPVRKTIFTGNPIRPEVFVDKDKFHFNNDLPVIYITGGNQGSLVLNQTVFKALPALLKMANVIHQTGEASETMELLENLQLPAELKSRYIYQNYFFAEDIGSVLHRAELVISRSGANTMSELLALGKMCILVPIPWVTHNEQFRNAQVLEKFGLARILPQNALEVSRLLGDVETGLEFFEKGLDWHGNDLAASHAKAMTQIRPDAARLITAQIQNLLAK